MANLIEILSVANIITGYFILFYFDLNFILGNIKSIFCLFWISLNNQFCFYIEIFQSSFLRKLYSALVYDVR